MLIGEYTVKLGDKKRLAIPKKFRVEQGTKLIITKGYENSLVIVNQIQWGQIAGEVTNGSFISKDIRETTRFLVGSANELEFDEQGRFVVPTSLLEYAGLGSEVVFVGLINWVEVWDKKKWEEKNQYLLKHNEEIAERLNESKSIKSNKISE